MPKNLPEVLQTPFDKAFIEVVEYLAANWKQHKKFRTKKELFERLKLNHKYWSEIKNAVRHAVPGPKIAEVRQYLINEFHVRASFLDKHTGKMFSDDVSWLMKEPGATYLTKDQIIHKLEEEIQAVNKELLALKKQNMQLQQKLLDAQQALIDEMKGRGRVKYSKPAGQKVGQLP